jgi:membrane protein required for colicin V production
MNIVDIVLAVLCVWFAVSGIARGLVRQLFSIGGLVAGHLAGIRFYGLVASMLKLSFQYNDVVGYLAVFLVVYLAVRLLGAFVEGRIRASKLSAADRMAGMVAGLAKGALVSVLVVFLLVILIPRDSRALRQSKAAPYAISAGRWLAQVFPDRIADSFREKAKAVEKFQEGVFPFRK